MKPTFGAPIDVGGVDEHWVEFYRARFTVLLEDIPGARPNTSRGDAVLTAGVRVVEELLGSIARALSDRESGLRQELRRTQTNVRLLERQLEASQLLMLEFQKSKNRRFIRAALAGLAALALAVAGGAAEGIASRATDGSPPESVDEPGRIDSFAGVALNCSSIDRAMEDLQPTEAEDVRANDAEGDSEVGSEDWRPDDEPIEQLGAEEFPSDLDPVEVAAWKDAGFTAQPADEWRNIGMTPAQASQWREIRMRAHLAEQWSNLGFLPDQAADWAYEEFEPRDASDWNWEGFDAVSAARWRNCDFDSYEADQWHEEGFAVDEAVELRAEGLTPEEARARLYTELFPDR